MAIKCTACVYSSWILNKIHCVLDHWLKKRENSIKWHFKEEWFGIEATRIIFLEAFNVKLELEKLKSFVNTLSDM